MDLLQHGVDRAVIALWLGHESVETTQTHLHADQIKEEALAKITPVKVKRLRATAPVPDPPGEIKNNKIPRRPTHHRK